MPFTRLVASWSVFVGAPAIAVLIVAMASRARRAPFAIATAAAIVFAVLAVANRVLQMVIMSLAAGSLPQALDLYVAGSPANFAELFAWDLCLGVACLSAAGSVTASARWPRRFLLATGALAVAGEACYLVVLLGVDAPAIGLAGMAVSATAWVAGLSATAISALACHAFRDAQARRVRPHPSSTLSRSA